MIEPGNTNTVDDLEIERLARERRRMRGLRIAARRALVLARRYREEEGPHGAREAACVAQALAWRSAARAIGGKALAGTGPGLARTTVVRSDASRRTG